jgi:ABC-type uncharacterized transport system YnjBCD ATPase subunit
MKTAKKVYKIIFYQCNKLINLISGSVWLNHKRLLSLPSLLKKAGILWQKIR